MMSNKMKECYDLSSQRQTLNRGDAVWLYNSQRNKGVTSKLACHWQGPYLITKRINDIIYRIQINPRTKPKVVHCNRLWKYSGKSPPTWLKTTEEHSNKAADTSTVETSQSSTNASTTREGHANDENATGSHSLTVTDVISIDHTDSVHTVSTRRKSSCKRKPPERYGQNSN